MTAPEQMVIAKAIVSVEEIMELMGIKDTNDSGDWDKVLVWGLHNMHECSAGFVHSPKHKDMCIIHFLGWSVLLLLPQCFPLFFLLVAWKWSYYKGQLGPLIGRLIFKYISYNRHFNGWISLVSNSAFYYNPVIQFRFRVIKYACPWGSPSVCMYI